jgi:hypothetical protein
MKRLKSIFVATIIMLPITLTVVFGIANNHIGGSNKDRREAVKCETSSLKHAEQNIVTSRGFTKTEDFLIIKIKTKESDLSVYELQKLYNEGWDLIAANSRQVVENIKDFQRTPKYVRYVFKKRK